MEYRAGNVAQLIAACTQSWVHSPAMDIMVCTYLYSQYLSGGRGGSEVKGHSQVNIESELRLGFEALSQKQKGKPEGLTPVGHWLAIWQRIFKEIRETCK